jgi:diphthamide synthase (EF-2-diphthine--ammonia ligase)
MNACCLVSGGKDSTYVMMKAIEAGYNIVCLASFYHVLIWIIIILLMLILKEEGDELDSWMFQSVTTNVVISLSECLGYPMYRMKFPKELKILNKDLDYFEISREINEVFLFYLFHR